MNLQLKMTKRQKAFCEAQADEILFGGAAGGGKSYAQMLDALLYALNYPGSKQLILRRTFPDLERSLILEHQKFYPLQFYQYNTTSHRGRFSNGSTIEFGYCDSEMDVLQYQSAEYDVIRFDELTHFTEYQYVYMMSRLRGVNPYPRCIKGSTNPGGPGHTWVKARFVDIGAPDEPHTVIDQETGAVSTRLFLPSKVTDNPLLMSGDPDYIKRLERLPEKERRALLFGDWDLHDGQFFAEFRREKHVCKPFAIPREWRRYVAIDYGMDMLAAFWIALAPKGRAYVYRELYEGRDNGKGEEGRGHIVSAAARRLQELNGRDEIYAWLAPPDLWNRNRDTGRSTAEIFADYGIYLDRVSNDRVHGWRAVREWLADRPGEQGEAPKPGLQVFETCVNLIRTLPQVQFDEKNPEDVAREPHELTHAPDALRAFCICHTSPAEPVRGNKHTLLDEFHIERVGDPLGLGEEIYVI